MLDTMEQCVWDENWLSALWNIAEDKGALWKWLSLRLKMNLPNYTPLYQKALNETKVLPMETTNANPVIPVSLLVVIWCCHIGDDEYDLQVTRALYFP